MELTSIEVFEYGTNPLSACVLLPGYDGQDIDDVVRGVVVVRTAVVQFGEVGYHSLSVSEVSNTTF